MRVKEHISFNNCDLLVHVINNMLTGFNYFTKLLIQILGGIQHCN